MRRMGSCRKADVTAFPASLYSLWGHLLFLGKRRRQGGAESGDIDYHVRSDKNKNRHNLQEKGPSPTIKYCTPSKSKGVTIAP